MFMLIFLVLRVKMHSFRERKREKRNVWETNGRTIKRLKQEKNYSLTKLHSKSYFKSFFKFVLKKVQET